MPVTAGRAALDWTAAGPIIAGTSRTRVFVRQDGRPHLRILWDPSPGHRRTGLCLALGFALVVCGCASTGSPPAARFPPPPTWPDDHEHSLDDLVELSIHHNAGLDAARYVAESTQGLIDQVKALWLPMFRYDFAAVGYSNDINYKARILDLISVNVPLTGAYNLNSTASAWQILTTSGKRSSLLGQARRVGLLQKIQVLQLQDAVAFDVANLYYLVCLAHETDNVLDAAIDRAAMLEQVLGARRRQGSLQVSTLDLLQAEMLVRQLRRQQIAARAARQQSYLALRTFVGVPPDRPLYLRSVQLPPLADRREVLSAAGTLARAFLARPEVYQAQLVVRILQEQVRFAKAGWGPNVGFLGAGTYTAGNHGAVLNALDGIAGKIVIDLPVYDPAARGRLRQMLGLEHASTALQRQVEEQIQLDIETARLEAEKTLAIVVQAAAARDAAIDRARLAHQAYAHHVLRADDVLQAIRTETDSRIDCLQALYAHHATRARLKRVLADRQVRYGH